MFVTRTGAGPPGTSNGPLAARPEPESVSRTGMHSGCTQARNSGKCHWGCQCPGPSWPKFCYCQPEVTAPARLLGKHFLRYYHDHDMMELLKRQATALAGSRLTAQGSSAVAGSCSSLARDNVICQRLNCRSACKRTVARSSHWHHHNGRRRSLRASGSAHRASGTTNSYPVLGSLRFKLPPGAACQRRTPGGEVERPLLRRPFEGRKFFRESIFID